jgi:hypothetical protein
MGAFTDRFRKPLLPALARQQQGTAVMEFGLIAPVFMMLLIGMYDITHLVYARSVFNGAVERAAREASLETGDTNEADQIVADIIRPVIPDVVIETERMSYFDFADIERPEQFTDANDNDICDEGEAYVDENSSGQWEEDIGVAGNGGAGDVVMYTAKATFTPLFKIPFMPESWSSRTMTATAIKKNQPFGDQAELATTAGTCTE